MIYFGNEEEIFMNDVEFCENRIILLPQLCHHKLEEAVCIVMRRIFDKNYLINQYIALL